LRSIVSSLKKYETRESWT